MQRIHVTSVVAVALGFLFTMALWVGPAEAIDLRDWGKKLTSNRFDLKFGGAAVLDKETQLV